MSCSIIIPKEIRELEKAEIFSVSKDKKNILLNGVINSSALDKFKTIANDNPTIKNIEIKNCDGSINDVINLELAKYIYDNEYDIHLLDNGIIASGGTDLFLAGRKRTKGSNTKIGVHSWAGNREIATDFPIGHAYHLPYIKYYVSVGFTQQQAENFYYYTINAATADSIHWMTVAEIKLYNFISTTNLK
ncbi:MAG: alpha/beta hydrolase [Flavobacteriaceae bacterium]|nr:alpha/beta hydrolase [Flavobacteriaceae bacterium]